MGKKWVNTKRNRQGALVVQISPENWLAYEVMEAEATNGFVKVAGISGNTQQAVSEATLASDIGYDVGLVSLAAMKNAFFFSTNPDLLERVKANHRADINTLGVVANQAAL